MSILVSPTPNPDAIKFSTDSGAFLAGGMEQFSTAAQAADHALGRRLFDLRGVASVFITPGFVTVTKAPDARWDGLVDPVTACLTEYLLQADAAG